MTCTQKLEFYWQTVISSFGSKTDLGNATVACYPEIPLYVLNHAANINIQPERASEFVNEIEHHFKTQKVPFACVRITPLTQPPTFINTVQAAGFRAEGGKQSVMVLNQPVLPTPSNQIEIKTVNSNADVDLFDQLMFEIFEMPKEWKTDFDNFTQECLQNGWQFYLAYLEGKAVGTAALFSAGGIGGVFDVGTLPQYRKMGIGSVLTLRALNDSVADGNQLQTLQAEAGGNAEHLYKKLGFTVDHTVQFYAKQFP